VHDASSEDAAIEAEDVLKVLKSIGAEKLPRIDIYNKQDLAKQNPTLDHTWQNPEGVETSALKGTGVEKVHEAIEAFFAGHEKPFSFTVPVAEGRKLAWLQAHGDVRHMALEDDHYTVDVVLSEEDAALFETM